MSLQLRGSSSTGSARPTATVLSTANMAKWLDKIATVRAGTGFAKLAFIGDSKTAGVFSGATLATSYPTGVKKRLGLVCPVTDGLAIANATVSMDPRWVTGGYVNSGGVGLAGAAWYGSTAAGADLTFTPAGSVDTFEVWCYNSATRGTIAVKIDGVAQTAINCSTGSGWTKTTFTVTAGAHTIQLPKPTVNDVYVLGIDAYLSTTKAVRVANWGVPGTQTGNWNNALGGLYSTLAIQAWAPDLSFIMLGGNDASSGVSAATFATNMGQIIDAAKTSGEVILVSTTQSNPAIGRLATEQAYRDQLVTLAASKDAPLIDAWDLYGAYNVTDWSDDVHLTARGYQRLARLVFDGLLHV